MAITVDGLKIYYRITTDEQLSMAASVSMVTIWKWKTKGIPYGRQAQFEVESKGKLKASKPNPIQLSA